MLDKLNLAVVDVETTGSSALEDRIIELGIHRIERGRRVASYGTLVNPQRGIPSSISRLTGIRDRDVEDAPAFRAVSERVAGLLEGCVFVAHNAVFDYGFVRNEFDRIGRPFSAPRLCSVKLSRLLFPHQRQHGLSHLIERFSIPCENRHRALDDAAAVWAFLEHVQATLKPEQLGRAVQSLLCPPPLPPGLSPQQLLQLPNKPGAYVFYEASGRALYVGCGVDINERAHAELVRDAEGRLGRLRQAGRIEAHPTCGRLGAQLLALHLRETLKPLHNPRRHRPARRLRLKPWPYPGDVLVEEPSGEGSGHLFWIDRWRLHRVLRYEDGVVSPWLSGYPHVDAEVYRLLLEHLSRPSRRVRVVGGREKEQLAGL